MTLFSILETLLIGPLKLAFEIIFALTNKLIVSPGLSIIAFSLIVNILVLPLYRRADAMQEQARDTEAKLRDGAAHIKKAFSGDERMMILQTYYRQNDYKPTDALKGSLSLLLEIPFFMAAYQFLSHLDLLQNASFGPIADLSQPDGLLLIGGLTLNLLPFVMTLINVISSSLYLKGFPLKTKIQLYGMALFFLVFLYNSPAGLVFYWTLNNLFSLIKTIFYKLKHPGRVIRILCSLSGVALPFVAFAFFELISLKRKLFILGLALLMQLPLIFPLLKKVFPRLHTPLASKPEWKMFLLSALFLTVLTGILIPSTYIAASPQEFLDVNYFHHPLWYVVSSACQAAGLFLVWLRVFYWLADDSKKLLFERVLWVFCAAALVNYMFFGTKLGNISPALQYEFGVYHTKQAQLINVLVIAVVMGVMYFVAVRWRRKAVAVLLTAVVALGGMSALNMVTIARDVRSVSIEDNAEFPHFRLSRNGKNVVVIMLDRALGEFVPYIMNEKPELQEQFTGFTYYSNTISHGGYTLFGTPGLYGGYEYTPVEMNRRSSESLIEKQNEALKVLPLLFSENGYEVTVCDPVYANYSWTPDLSIFDEYPDIKTYNTLGKFTDEVQKRMLIYNNTRNFFVFSMMKSMPLFTQSSIYNNGLYLRMSSYNGEENVYWVQQVADPSHADGILYSFMESYNVLDKLPAISEVTDESINTFMSLSNAITHEHTLLQTPDYTPSWNVDNAEYDAAHADRFTLDGRTLIMENGFQMMHYHANMAALLQMGEWFDYLREQGVYDNTRIILVADHGQLLFSMEELMLGDGSLAATDVELYFPLLMVKDFDSSVYETSDEFMTNADVPTLALKDLVENPVNPFTGKEINDHEKTAHEQFIIMSQEHNTGINRGHAFLPSPWASVKDNIWVEDNWTFYEGEHVLTEHQAP